jgi:hypothetical protein
MEGSMSVKRRVAEKALMPIVAAGASAAASYVVKNGPGFVEDTLLPKVREGAKGAGEAAEKLPDLTDKLPEQLTQKARDVTGLGGGDGESSSGGSGSLSAKDLSQRVEERAQGRAKRRNATRR